MFGDTALFSAWFAGVSIAGVCLRVVLRESPQVQLLKFGVGRLVLFPGVLVGQILHWPS